MGNLYKAYDTENNKWATILLAVLFHFCALTGFATTYFVSNSGNDANSGITPQTPWKTISKVNNFNFSPGDQILFKRGDEWREQLTIPSSGSPVNPIVFAAYGNGPKPVINGSDLVKDWSQVNNSHLWHSSVSDPKIVLFDNELGIESLTIDALDTDGEWFWSGGLLYIYSKKKPSTRKIEAGTRDYGIIDENDQRNIHINNIEVKGQKRMGIAFRGAGDVPNSGIYISNCYVHHTRLMGFWFYEYDGVIVTDSRAEYTATGFYCSPNANNTTFRRDTSLYNIAYRNGINTNGSTNDGSGFGIEESGGCIIEYCVAYDNGDGGFVVDNNNVDGYGAILRYNKALGSEGFELSNNAGFYIARIGAGATLLMHHNVSFNYGRKWNSNLFVQVTEAADIKVYNNTFVNPSTVDGDVIRWYRTENANVDFRNNIVVGYQVSVNGYQLHDATSNDFTYSDYNLYYSPGLRNPFKLESKKYADLDEWTAKGFDANSVEGNPLFSNEFTDFSLQPGSPAVDAGTGVGLTKDILGNPIVGTPDIGAYELQKKNEVRKYTTEAILICEGESYEGWTATGQYKRTLTAVSGADSIVTTNLLVIRFITIPKICTSLKKVTKVGRKATTPPND